MKRPPRVAISGLLGLAVAASLPVYPLRSELRSFVAGGSGDLVDYPWSFYTFFGFLAHVRYASPLLAFALADSTLLALLSALFALALFAVSKRALPAPRSGG